MCKIINKNNFDVFILILLPFLFYFGVKFLVLYNTQNICVFKILTGHPCPGCGMTRAFNELFSFHFIEAYRLNPRIVIVAPLLVYIWFSTLQREIQNRFKNS